MKKIKSSTLIDGNMYRYSLYKTKDIIKTAKLISRPNCQIGLMEDDDRFVFEHEDGSIIEFQRNVGEPHFLITYVQGKKPNSKVIDRVIFYNMED